jgi:ligand-binding sensor protein
MKHSRGSKEGLRRCMESDAFGGAESAKTGKPAVYTCGSGLMDFGAPILINGKQIGSILGGQVLPKAPDKDKFVEIAKELNVNPDKFLEALDKVHIVSEEKLKDAAELLFVVTNEISKMGYQRLILKNIVQNLHENVTQIMATIEQLTASAADVTSNQTVLNKEIQNVNTISDKITNMTESIKSVSEQSRLLGLNAAIEAARAGEAGLGFGVVAKEIHKMSNESKTSVENIRKFTVEINSSLSETLAKSDATLEITTQQETAIKSIVESIDEIVTMTETLSHLVATN